MVKTIETTHDKSDIIIQLLNAQKARQFREEYLDLHVYEQKSKGRGFIVI